jgi:hypothetical protein
MMIPVYCSASLPPAACVAIFLICLGATGSPLSATLIVVTLCMLLVDLMGFMALAGIQLNAGGVLRDACGKS